MYAGDSFRLRSRPTFATWRATALLFTQPSRAPSIAFGYYSKKVGSPRSPLRPMVTFYPSRWRVLRAIWTWCYFCLNMVHYACRIAMENTPFTLQRGRGTQTYVGSSYVTMDGMCRTNITNGPPFSTPPGLGTRLALGCCWKLAVEPTLLTNTGTMPYTTPPGMDTKHAYPSSSNRYGLESSDSTRHAARQNVPRDPRRFGR